MKLLLAGSWSPEPERSGAVFSHELEPEQGRSLTILMGGDLKFGALLHHFGALLYNQRPYTDALLLWRPLMNLK